MGLLGQLENYGKHSGMKSILVARSMAFQSKARQGKKRGKNENEGSVVERTEGVANRLRAGHRYLSNRFVVSMGANLRTRC